MKETYYFQHDYNSRNDLKLIALRSKFKSDGIALFWTVIELLHEEESHRLPLSEITFISIADQSGVSCEAVKEILNYSIEVLKLFKKSEDEHFYSERVLRNFENRKSISEVRRRSAKIKHKKGLEIIEGENDANETMQNLTSAEQNSANAMQSSANAVQKPAKKIKEKKKKEKEIKEKEIKENNNYFENNELNNKYLEFLEFRKELGKPVTKTAIKEQVDMLRTYSVETAIKMIANSIVNGYQGIFELKENQSVSGRDSPNYVSTQTRASNNSFRTQIKFLKELIEDASPLFVPKWEVSK